MRVQLKKLSNIPDEVISLHVYPLEALNGDY